MQDLFTDLEEFAYLLMDEIGVVEGVEWNGETHQVVIALEDGCKTRCNVNRIVRWHIDACTGKRELSRAIATKRCPTQGTPVTFAWNSPQTAPSKVLVWEPRMFRHAWPEVRLVQRGVTGLDKVLWQGRDMRLLRKEHPPQRGSRNWLEAQVAGNWYPYKQVVT